MNFKVKKKIHGPREYVSGHFSSRQWKGGGIDGRVGPRTGASDRMLVGAGFSDDVSHILDGGRVTVVVPVRWQEGLRGVFLRALTRGRLLVLGVNPLQGSAALDSWMWTTHGICPWDSTLWGFRC